MVARTREASKFAFQFYIVFDRNRYEPRRQAAVLVLKELAQNSPTLFYVHVSTFVELIWVALRDPKVIPQCSTLIIDCML